MIIIEHALGLLLLAGMFVCLTDVFEQDPLEIVFIAGFLVTFFGAIFTLLTGWTW